ncbi:MAG: hypothetical protein ORN98_00255 [Alphaproteobacteria bacterium]|nr:hypothetical protein [Alphaproteobacteria bacterium]
MIIIPFSSPSTHPNVLKKTLENLGKLEFESENRAVIDRFLDPTADNDALPEKTVTIRVRKGEKSKYSSLKKGDIVQVYWGQPRNGGVKVGVLPIRSIHYGRLVDVQGNLRFYFDGTESYQSNFWWQEGFANYEECLNYWRKQILSSKALPRPDNGLRVWFIEFGAAQ